MDPSKNRAANRLRKTPRKPGGAAVESRSAPAQSPIPNNLMSMSSIWDFNGLAGLQGLTPYFSMLNMKDGYQPQSLLYSSTSTPSTPLSDLMNMSNFASYSSMFVPLSRSRTSSFLPSESSDSSRRGSEDYAPIPSMRSYSSAAVERPCHKKPDGYGYSKDGKPHSSRSASSMSSAKNSGKNPQPLLPSWALDINGALRQRIPLAQVLDSGELEKFALDKNGCQYLQDAFRKKLTVYQKFQVFEQVIGKKDNFIKFSTNLFGNFLVQQVMEMSMKNRDEEHMTRQENMKDFISSQMTDMCLDKSACRVVQFALEHFDSNLACELVQSLPRDSRLIAICVDQNANHVIQKVVAVIPLQNWDFIVDFIAQSEHLRQICSDKYGCRVVQTIIEKLTITAQTAELDIVTQTLRERALQRLMTSVTNLCQELATNEYANYIIQHIVSNDDLSVYRECIIEKCLMRNLLSLSQEKFASHVVEKAFLKAPLDLLAEMMDEIFDGYVPHPDTGKDALDIMMFHQFGNYVVQCMLTICCDAVSGKRETKEGSYDHMKSFHDWLKKLQHRISKERHRLSRFSSGKKMIETLATLRLTHPFLGLHASGLPSFKFECFSTASEDEDGEPMPKSEIEKGNMHLTPRGNGDDDSFNKPSSPGDAHDGDDEAGTFSM